MRRNRQRNISGDLSIIESVGITFALSAEVLFRVGDMLYRSSPVDQVIAVITKHVQILMAISFSFAVISCVLSIMLSKLLGYNTVNKPVLHTLLSGIQCTVFSVLLFVIEASLFVGVALLGAYFESAIIYVMSVGLVLLCFSLAGVVRGVKAHAVVREWLVSVITGVVALVIGLPAILFENVIVMAVTSVLIATLVRTVVLRVITVNDQLRAQASKDEAIA